MLTCISYLFKGKGLKLQSIHTWINLSCHWVISIWVLDLLHNSLLLLLYTTQQSKVIYDAIALQSLKYKRNMYTYIFIHWCMNLTFFRIFIQRNGDSLPKKEVVTLRMKSEWSTYRQACTGMIYVFNAK